MPSILLHRNSRAKGTGNPIESKCEKLKRHYENGCGTISILLLRNVPPSYIDSRM